MAPGHREAGSDRDKKRAGPAGPARTLYDRVGVSAGLADVGGLIALGALNHLELDSIPLGEAAEPLRLDGSMMHEDIPHFVEINARLGGGLPLAIAAGVDVPALLLSDIAGLSMSGLDRDPQLGVFMTRCDESFFLTEATNEQPTGGHLRPR